jgi:hypothetical protein
MTRYHNEAICDRCGVECNGSPGGHTCADLAALEEDADKYAKKFTTTGTAEEIAFEVIRKCAYLAAGRKYTGLLQEIKDGLNIIERTSNEPNTCLNAMNLIIKLEGRKS